MYNNYNNYNNSGNGSYNGAPYRNNFQYGNRGNYRPTYGNQRPQKKRSGAKMGFANGEAGRPWVRGWRVSKRFGLITYMCGTYKGTRRVTSGTGKEWESWICSLKTADGKSQPVPCLYCVDTQKVVIKSLGIVINHKAPNGGYCGRYGKK